MTLASLVDSGQLLLGAKLRRAPLTDEDKTSPVIGVTPPLLGRHGALSSAERRGRVRVLLAEQTLIKLGHEGGSRLVFDGP